MSSAPLDGSNGLLFAADMLVKSLATLGLAGAAAWLLKRRGLPAGMRNGVWALCFAALLALPFLSLLRLALPPAAGEYSLPGRYRVPVPVSAPTKTPAPVAPPPFAQAKTAPLPQPAFFAERTLSAEPARTISPPNTAPVPLVRTLLLCWSLGTVLVLARTLAGLILVSRLAREGSALVADGPILELLNECKRVLSIARPVKLCVGRDDRCAPEVAASPMTWGCLRPTILLPADARDWEQERVRAVLLHELAHVARNDWAAQVLLARTVCALYWFHPLVWLAAACFRAEAERACDESVLNAGMSAPDYAGHLLAVARSLRPAATAILPFGRL